jgi:hypothetical protein
VRTKFTLSVYPSREARLDGSYALSASANKIDGATADTVRLQFRKFKREDKSRKAKQSRSKRERAKKRKPRLNKKDEPVIREVIHDKRERDINVSDELTFISRGIALS